MCGTATRGLNYMASRAWQFFRRAEEKKPEEAPETEADARDLPRVVTTNAAGRWPELGGGSRLGVGRRSGIRAGDLTDLILPFVVVVGALAVTNRGCTWRAGSLGRYVPSAAIQRAVPNTAAAPQPAF